MTHNERVLALLSDGAPHSHHELYALHVMGHSRISNLRQQGHVIECWRDGSSYWYQLIPSSSLEEADGFLEPSSLSASSSGESNADLGPTSGAAHGGSDERLSALGSFSSGEGVGDLAERALPLTSCTGEDEARAVTAAALVASRAPDSPVQLQFEDAA
jgi:hypothetical protein